MAEQPAMTLTKIAIRVAAAGFGATVAGPLGCALGAAFGDALTGPLGDMVGKLVEEGGKKAAEKLFDAGGDTLAEKIKGSGGNLDAAYREALRLSLAAMRPQLGGYQDWFEHWERCLKAKEALRLEVLRADQLTQEQMNAVLRRTLVRLDAQGAMLLQKSSSIAPLVEREMPEALDAVSTRRLPGLFDETFQALIVSDEYELGCRQLMLALGRQTVSHTSLLPQMAADVAAIRAATETFKRKKQAGLVTAQQIAEKDSVIAWQAQEIYKLRQELLAQASEPTEIRLEKLVRAGDLPGAVQLKLKQVAARESEAAKRPRDYYELGKLHEVQFEWAAALDAYRRAWRLEQSFKYGFQYAYLAQKQNRHKEAIRAYEATRLLSENPESAALTLNNLAILYHDTQRLRDAEQAYDEALSIYRQLAEENPEAYLPDVATTLNNLANLYRETQRMRDAERVFDEALSTRRQLAKENPEAYLPCVASTLNNLANLYRETQRMRDAELAYDEALSIYRELAEENPEAYLPYVATTLNNLAVLYSDTQRMRDAELAYDEALSIRRQLAEENPEAYLPYVASTLNNLAILYRDTQQMQDAELAYDEALSIYRQLAKENPEAHLPDVARTLNNLAGLYRDTQRTREAEQAFDGALSIRRQLATENPEAYLPDVARTLNNLAVLYSTTQRRRDAELAYDEALSIRRRLAKKNPEAYLPYVARTLNNLANLYRATRRGDEALRLCREAESILRPLWHRNPAMHGDQMARVLWVLAYLTGEGENSTDEACRLAREALNMAYDPAVKAGIQEAIERWCGDAGV